MFFLGVYEYVVMYEVFFGVFEYFFILIIIILWVVWFFYKFLFFDYVFGCSENGEIDVERIVELNWNVFISGVISEVDDDKVWLRYF